MKKKQIDETAAVEAEIIDENGVLLTGQKEPPRLQAKAGFLTGFVALAFSFIMMLLMAVFMVFIIFPLMLLGRILGLQIKTLRK